ncbi:UDP-4-amino-4,6-dideoxy-N-acetyl-beta-L-altrosamine transaminase [Shewanella sedimentimangrovi]|uniref:UDP-4-amino-4, 6-dideoxy-N-acetyl-beta-L-altrosamine transaminase n=1 Tax=Shewanella sedimentimangrovi TaxID=2814293 RepID=A0ABX7QX83_9GAMM|nr:UDP-4-amino-4,6-dideoxy-N-acetyl-beta-L-altrosamine transaminase [Shewanella sedimentimangrovi]QSX36121.1 UDP-4-amino-4,6-dideoxy-N-acetyl-beta-L-altrosamine transaminase [Shewanella sedimentimangrovi]
MILYGRQDISPQDIAAVVEVLNSDFLTQGPRVPAFEQAICDLTQATHAVAVNSATSALHIACLALGVGAGDLVWTSPITFVASANCALYCGAEVDFVDVEPTTGNMSPAALKAKLETAQTRGRLPKVIIPVHLAGHSCDMKTIGALARQYGVSLVEDASHSVGGTYDGDRIGACSYSDITVFSFHPVKIITTAEGGVATTNDARLAEKMALYRSHGITKAVEKLQRPDEGPWYYEQQELGFNYRMTELQAALGLSQLDRLQTFVEIRNRLAESYRSALTGSAVKTVDPLAGSLSAYHLQIVRLPDPAKRRAVFEKMQADGIQVHVHYFPVHLQPYYLGLGFKEGDFPDAEAFYRKIMTLPLHPGIKVKEVDYIVECLLTHVST